MNFVCRDQEAASLNLRLIGGRLFQRGGFISPDNYYLDEFMKVLLSIG